MVDHALLSPINSIFFYFRKPKEKLVQNWLISKYAIVCQNNSCVNQSFVLKSSHRRIKEKSEDKIASQKHLVFNLLLIHYLRSNVEIWVRTGWLLQTHDMSFHYRIMEEVISEIKLTLKSPPFPSSISR